MQSQLTSMSNSVSQNNKRIAKNTLFLYIRMLISIVVSLYTSRVVLETLGVEDYGIYGLVGGVVGMFSFLNSAMSGATSRFLTFDIGKGDKGHLAKTFSSAMIIHICIAFVILVLSLTIGLWFLANKLVIPEVRMTSAYWVYICSILSMFVSVTQVPYNSAIIAHEKMNVYAYVELLNVVLKLLIVYLLVIGNFDKLILYACLMLAVSVIVAMTYRIFCIRHFEESHFHWIWDKAILKSISSFSLYNLLGNFGAIFNLQGTNFLINIFFGVALNAGASVAATVSGIVQGFVSNVITAFRPPVTKAYAQQDYAMTEQLLKLALISSVILNSIFTIPLLLEIDTVLQLWLGIVPDYADVFCRVILISIFFETIRYILTIGVHAVGKLRVVSIITGLLYIMNPFVIYALLHLGFGPKIVYMGNIVINILLCIWIAYFLQQYIPQIKVATICSALIIPITIALSTLGITKLSMQSLNHGFLRVITTSAMSGIMIVILSYVFCLSRQQRMYVNNKIKHIIKR